MRRRRWLAYCKNWGCCDRRGRRGGCRAGGGWRPARTRGAVMATVVFAESAQDELSRQAIAFAQQIGEPVHAVAVRGPYAPRGWAQAIVAAAEEQSARFVIGPG